MLHLDAIENKPPDLDVAFRLSFKKARERTPANRLDFVDATITLNNDKWTGVLVSNARGKINESLTREILRGFCALPPPAAERCKPDRIRLRASTNGARNARRWVYSTQGKADSARSLFSRHKRKLIAENWIGCSEELAWVLP